MARDYFDAREKMKFYDCKTAPSPRRVRMFIAEKGIDVETVEVDLRNREQLQPDFLAINPHATVPALELDDGTVLTNSMAICTLLDGTFPDNNLLGNSPKERAVIYMAQHEMEFDGLQAIAECFRNSSRGFVNRALTGPHDYAQNPDLAERGRQRVERFYESLDQRLADQEYVAGDRFTVADITAFIALEFSPVTKTQPADSLSNLHRWYAKISKRDSASV
jgi:glutathione S-transferase